MSDRVAIGLPANYNASMSHLTWRDAVAAIRKDIGFVTATQKKLATIAGLTLPKNLPRLVAGARLQTALCFDLGLAPPGPCTYQQEELISKLRGDSEDILATLVTEAEWLTPPFDRHEADAWITYLLLKARLSALERLQIEAGDLVIATGSGDDQVEEVSSIGSNGRIYFKGGMGAGAWPDWITIRSRKHDDNAEARTLRQRAANRAAHRTRISAFSESKHRELEEFEVKAQLTSTDIEQLRETIEAAQDEAPIQRIIEDHPQILTALLGGKSHFLLSRQSLAGTYIPDFLISDYDSAGVRWILVELETPLSSVTLKDRNDLDRHARRGVSQVKEWREWLQDNLDFARRSKKNHGLGLVDIRPRSEGLVLVGRRERLNDNSHTVRRPIHEDQNIRVHTYDWLIERLTGILNFVGPSGVNPYMIQPLRDDAAN